MSYEGNPVVRLACTEICSRSDRRAVVKKCIRHKLLFRGLTINVMTSKERLAPMSELPVIVVSTLTSAEFRARNNVLTERNVGESCLFSS